MTSYRAVNDSHDNYKYLNCVTQGHITKHVINNSTDGNENVKHHIQY